MINHGRIVFLLILLNLVLTLSGCGHKGELYLPSGETVEQSDPAAETRRSEKNRKHAPF